MPRGGARPGAGRKAKSDTERLVVISFRGSPEAKARFEALQEARGTTAAETFDDALDALEREPDA